MIPKVSIDTTKTVVLVGMTIITITDAWKGHWEKAIPEAVLLVLMFILLVKVSITIERDK